MTISPGAYLGSTTTTEETIMAAYTYTITPGTDRRPEPYTLAAEIPCPELRGSEKQTAWAAKLRDQALSACLETLAHSRYKGEVTDEQVEAALARVRAEVAEKAEAKWWIDQRGRDAHPVTFTKRMLGPKAVVLQ